MSEHDFCHIMTCILEGINYCHKNGVSHRDLKPENILINDRNQIKIIDFGFASNFHNSTLVGQGGTRSYQAPEVLKNGDYNEKCDIWSIGHIFYMLLTCTHPYDDEY